jgi:hypothetical protein
MKHITKLAFIILLTTTFFTGCNLFDTVSIEERIDQFITDCNSSNKDSMYLNLHPTETVDRPAKVAASTWGDFTDALKPWSISETSRTGSTEVTFIGTISNNTISNEAITIVFKEGDEDVWYIKSLVWGAVTID